MFGEKIKFGSDDWIPEIRNLCLNYIKTLQKYHGGRFLKFRDELGTVGKPGLLVTKYHKTATLLKNEIYGKKFNQSLIDHHKIAALYIYSFLKCEPFYLDIPDETKNIKLCLYTELPNEYFSISFLATSFRAWNNSNGILRINSEYSINFIKLLHHYKENIDNLDFISCILSLANIIYLIEQLYFQRTDK